MEARIVLASILKQCVFCLPNASESVKYKIWDCIEAKRAWRWATFIMHELCRVRTGNYDSFVWGKDLQKIRQKNLKYGTSLGTLLLGPFGSNVMTKCPILNNGTSLRSSIGFGMNSSSMPKRLGTGWSNKLRWSNSLWRDMLQGFDKLGMIGMLFVWGSIYISSGTGRGNTTRLSSLSLGCHGGLGIVLGWWDEGVVLGMIGPAVCPWWGSNFVTPYVTVICAWRALPSLGEGAFSWFWFIRHWMFDLLTQFFLTK